MAVNWDLFRPVDTSERWDRGFARGQAMMKEHRLQSALAAFGQNPADPAAQSALARYSPEFAMRLGQHKWDLALKDAERRRISTYYGNGTNSTDAARAAYAAGDPEVGSRLLQLGRDERTVEAQRAKDFAPYAYQAMKMPAEARPAFFQSQRPQLKAIGLTDAEIDALDVSDSNLGGMIQRSMSVEELQTRDRVTWHTRIDGSTYATDYWGNIVGENGVISRPAAVPPTPSASAGSSTPSGSPLDPLAPAPPPPPPPAKPLAANANAFLLSKAEEAIASGANPDEVWAQFTEMGGTR